ncbi:MAG: HXXEE domain-containing protein [Pyrinomonadaceae bacterium]|nr:HXXEE domain-containing protein [Pyrinomonadaceae bacterium]
MDEEKPNRFSVALLLSPFIFLCHFLEESPGFVGWFNAHVARGITSGLFWRVNITALVITVTVVAIEWSSRSAFSLSLVVAWLSFLMLANAVLHIVAAFVDQQYVPGLATAVLLYVPYYFWLLVMGVKSKRLNVIGLVGAAVSGSMLMLIHGYLILFRGNRLF